ncbi:MAG: thiamine pyrophosphate-dependent enzyme, partial [Pseudobdellovibrionaceae bacterium]|nr:thiamine pyrophosphate-dependent enzyme [Pseudobdellovibrionaceae bacterium]
LMSRPSMDVLQQKKIIFLHSRSKPTFDGNGMRVILGDVPLILRDITRPWTLKFQTPPTRPQALEIPFQTGPHTVPMARAIHHLAEAFPPETDIFVDAGNTGAAAIHLYPQYGRSRFSVALGMGGMGHSFGCAIGATAVTKKRSLVIAGDGSFYMYGLEIHTAWEHQLPVVFVLFNNNGHAMCHIREALYLGTPGGANLFQPARLGAGMRAMLPGLPAFDVYNETELHTALQQIKNIEGPAVISIQTDPEEPPPFKPFLTRRPYAFPNTQS